MKIIKKKKRSVSKDPKKERIFKNLSDILEGSGYKVRRERLKTGHGWRVLSGKCRHERNKYVFVDSILAQDDQIEFLASRIQELEIDIPEELREDLPSYL